MAESSTTDLTVEPVVEAPASVEESPVEPVVETPVSLAMSPVEPVAEAPTSVDEPSVEPVVETPASVDESRVEPVVETPASIMSPVEPVVETPTSIMSPVEPVVETPASIMSPVEPVVEAPVVEAPASLVKPPVEPVAEAPASLIKSPVEPVVETPTSIMSPVEPVVETPASIMSPVEPVVETPASLVKSPVEPIVETPTSLIKSPVEPVVEAPTSVDKPPVRSISKLAAHPEHKSPPLAELVPSRSRSSSLEEGEIPQSPAIHQRARLQANPQQPTGRRGPDRQVRSKDPSPEPQFNEPQDQQPTASLGDRQSRSKQPRSKQPHQLQPIASLKRKRTQSNPPGLGRRARKQRIIGKTCVELGYKFSGAIIVAIPMEADEVARCIHELPVPQQVTRRLVLYSDACIRDTSAAAGIVWKSPTSLPEWDGLGVGYPSNTNNSGVVELYAIACAMKFALDHVGHPAFAVSSKNSPGSSHFWPGTRSMSHTHTMKRETMLFTDDRYALQRLDSALANPVGGPHWPLLKAICDLSQLLAQSDVHLELHWSPGHADIPGNEAAHDMSRRAEIETNLSRTMEERERMPMAEKKANRPKLGWTVSFAGPEVTGAAGSPLNFPSHLSLPIRSK
ncbi:hypothetical protein EN45_077590 [Penicillium chrysogenum]|uniref:Pc21g15590 protein n=2 Tax=Penicillium chrysogenum species complex TaxID=254878 RepID=B6HJV7_PENRW|nr:hypothetical protein EN45_077590 [Penicillium chrysogenum]CAP96456.1 Pc21g15590 [Penicillium rubens Wisconsin 54-1255]